MVLWKDRLEDDGATLASEDALRRLLDGVISNAVRGVRLAFVEGDLSRQSGAVLLLELVRVMRRDLRRGGWARLAIPDRRELRRALLVLDLFASSRTTIPLA